MSFDLKLTDTGDFSFISTNGIDDKDSFTYNFHIATSDSLLFNFNIENAEKEILHNDMLIYNFYIFKPSWNKKFTTVTEHDYIEQAIKLRLNTEFNTIKGNENIGSNLYTVLHENLSNDKLKTKIINIIQDAIFDILPKCEIEVFILNTNYLNYHDSIKIVIKDNEDVYYYYL